MRPIKLELQNFGPFKSEHVDFSALHGRMFILTGPTGSGKSMIFNAILYALFGTDSKHKTFRSQFAIESDKSVVCLDFEMGNKQYRVERTMTIQREDKSDVPPKALLKFLDGDTIATGVKAVTEAVHEIIHLNEHQFKQILLLPQGAFKEFLVSSSDEKSKILSTLFHAERFISFEKELEFSMKDKRRSLEMAQTKLDHLFSQVKFKRLDDDSLLEKYDAAVGSESQLLFIGEVNHGCLQQIELKEKELNKIEKDLELLKKSISDREAHNAEVEKFNHLREKLTELNLEREEIEEERLNVAQCKRAKIMMHQVDSYEKIEKQKQANAARRDAIIRDIDAFNERLEILKEGQKILNEQESDIENKLEFIQSTRQFIGDDYSKLEAELKKSRIEVERLSQEINVSENKKSDLELTRDSLKINPEIASSLEEKLDTINDALKQCHEHLHYNDLSKKKIDTEVKINQINAQLKQYLEENRGLYSRDDQQAIEHLKQHLAVGDNCPVCQQVLVELPTHNYFDRETEREINALHTQLSTLQNEQQKVDIEQQLYKERIEDFKEITTDVLSAQLSKYNEKKILLTEQLEQTEKNQKSYYKVLEALNELSVQLSGLNSQFYKASSRLEGLEEKHNKFLQATEHGNYEIFQEEFNLCVKMTDAYQQRKNKLTQDIQNLTQQLELASQRKAHILEEHTRLDEEHNVLGKSLEDFIEEEGIPDLEALKIRIHTDTSDKEKKIDIFDEAFKTVRSQLDIHYENKTTEYREISGYEKESLQELANTRETSSKHLTLLKNDFEENKRLYETFSELTTTLKKDLEAFNQHYKIFEVISGRGPEGISLHRFVLTYHLDRVLEQANIRLEEMTNARYTLLRTVAANRKGTAAGLEIRVHDSFSGTTRHVDTLSGGETFQASLALALAINEIIIQSSGGIQLDTILIDEGFGTLDQETLNQAIESLLNLETSGKMVGIISHVEELKHQLEYKIEVIPNNESSTTRLHV